ncbi:MAG: hypothetical protein PWP31_1911 [Clostridia bacterium]|nr:hypothetical protein [Clostridia bacterium]
MKRMNSLDVIPFVDLKAQYSSIKEEIDEALQRVIASAEFIGGSYVSKFEEEFAAYVGVKHCVGVGNGTDGLYIALKAVGVGVGDEVIVPANTFIGTAEAVSLTGARVVFADCDPKTYTVTVDTVSKVITSKTRAIVPVHLYGNPAPIIELCEFAEKNNLFVIEDAAQAHGAMYKGAHIGSFGDAAVFSFYPGKNLGAYGDAGCIVTNNDEIAKYARMYSNHGRIKKYDHEFEGVNSRLDGIQAAVLSVKLKYLPQWTEKRRWLARKYSQLLSELPVVLPVETTGGMHVYHLFVIRLKNRDIVKEKLAEMGIKTGVHYPVALPNLKAYEYLKGGNACPVSELFSREILSLPMYPELAESQLARVCESLETIINEIYG